jgi:PAS domain S-box-containing protein
VSAQNPNNLDVAAEALRASELRYRRLFESAKDGILILDAETGMIVDVNPFLIELLGISREAFLSKKVWELGFLKDIAANEAKFAELRAQEQIRYENLPLESAAGRPIAVEFVSNVYLVNGHRVIQCNIRDITERKRAGQELIESRQRLSRIVGSAMDAIISVDAAQRIVLFNAAAEKMFRCPAAETIGQPLDRFIPERFRAAHVGHVKVFGESGATSRAMGQLGSLSALRADGEEFPMEASISQVVVGNQKLFTVILRDVTERKKAEVALQEANATLEQRVQARTVELAQRATQLRALAGELTLSEQRERSRLAKVLHDHLQQLLVAAKFRLALLGRSADDLMKQATKEIEELIDESIASSRSLTAELSPPILHEAGLNAGLEWLARRMAERQGLLVDLELQETGALPDDLKILLFESVRELLFNVAKHAQTRSSAINVRRVDGFLQLTVSDRGVGFDPEVMTKAGESGRGFGLFSVRERLELFGGRLEIQSAPAEGSLVFLSVPITQQTAVQPKSTGPAVFPEAIRNDRILTPNSGRKIRILLADDHAVVRQGIGNLLSDEPDIEIVGSAADGQEAVEFAARLLPDVILMDMSMPKLNGVEATRIIHNDWPEIRIIGLSMFEETERAQAMRDAGAVDYITKSGPAEAMIDVIRSSVRASNKTPS